MEERRLLLAIVLSLGVVMAYSWMFPPPPAPAPPASKSVDGSSAVPSAAASAPAEPGATRLPASASLEPPRPEATPAPRVQDTLDRRVEVTAPEYAVAFTNRGARLFSWKLLRYRDAQGKPEEMVSSAALGVRPLDLETGDPALDARLREALFQPSSEALAVVGSEAQELRFTFSDGELEAEKAVAFRAQGLTSIRVSVKRRGQAVPCRVLWGPGLGNPTAEERSVQGFSEPQAVALVRGSVELYGADKLSASGTPLAGARWVGVGSQYFAAVFVPSPGAGALLRAVAPEKPGADKAAAVAAVEIGPEAAVALYVGAKDHRRLAALGHELERVVQLGDWIGPIVLVLMEMLRWVHSHVSNWGWAIVVLTVLINLVMAPFRHYSIVNGMRMARVAPEMRVIQERYRKLPLMERQQRVQEEMAALYARHGMKMSSQFVGCLPILLTMPFLFAFYRVLTVAVELRGAPFLWIPDLAHKDPLFVTPVLMGVSMFAMQKMTPSTMDPAQQRIMMLMPLMFAGMFLWAPAGLNLYWFTSNLWSIVQQGASMRLLKPDVQPLPKERRGR